MTLTNVSRWMLASFAIAMAGCTLPSVFRVENVGTGDGSQGDGSVLLDAQVDGASNPDAATGDSANDGGCPAGMVLCGSSCVDTQSSTLNCGACGTRCDTIPNTVASSATCSGGTCLFVCQTQFADCDPHSAGCETDLSAITHCGTCATQCTSGTVCTAAAPGVNPPYSCQMSCSSASPTLCGSSCTNTMTDPANCGTCAHGCSTPTNGSSVCTGGQCDFNCLQGSHRCGLRCPSDTDATACGSSCVTCSAPANATAVCANGTCAIQCNTGLHNCGGSCVSDSSITQCGASCVACAGANNASAVCRSGACAIACSTGFRDCNSNAADGCEIDVNNSNTNCGTCGHSCGTCLDPGPPVTHFPRFCDMGVCGDCSNL